MDSKQLKQVVHRTWCCGHNLDAETAKKIEDKSDPRPILDQILDRLGFLEIYQKCNRPTKNFEYWWYLVKKKHEKNSI